MKMLQAVTIGLVSCMGFGCATQKPVLTDDQYTEVGEAWLTLKACTMRGAISADVSARGERYFDTNLQKRNYDLATLNERIDWLKKNRSLPTDATCNLLAAQIAKGQQQIAINNQNAQVEQAEINRIIDNRPKQTYCNKIGIQTFCNTY